MQATWSPGAHIKADQTSCSCASITSCPWVIGSTNCLTGGYAIDLFLVVSGSVKVQSWLQIRVWRAVLFLSNTSSPRHGHIGIVKTCQ